MLTDWKNGSATWHELLRSFVELKELYICGALSQERSRALKIDGLGLDRRLPPRLQVLRYRLEIGHANNLFPSFVNARRVAGHPVSLSVLPVYVVPLTFPSPSFSS